MLSPYVTARIQRFGVYATDEIALTPEPFNAHLGIDLAAASRTRPTRPPASGTARGGYWAYLGCTRFKALGLGPYQRRGGDAQRRAEGPVVTGAAAARAARGPLAPVVWCPPRRQGQRAGNRG